MDYIAVALIGPHWQAWCYALGAGLAICLGLLRVGYWLRYPPKWLVLLRGPKPGWGARRGPPHPIEDAPIIEDIGLWNDDEDPGGWGGGVP